MSNVLITYFTKTNTTKEISEFMATALKNTSHTVTVLPIEAVTDLTPYDLVVIGSPINGMRWVPEPVNFVSTHLETLKSKKVAYFSVSYLYNNSRQLWRKAICNNFNKINDGLAPIATAVFGGRVEKAMPGIARVIFGLKKDRPLDLVEEKEIAAFANLLVEKLA